MNTIKIEPSENNVVINFSEKPNSKIDLTCYRTYLVKMLEKTNFRGDPSESYFAYLINLIFTNNLAELILEKVRHLNCDRIAFQKNAGTPLPHSMKVSGILDQTDIMADVLFLILHSKEYLAGEFAVEFFNEEGLSSKSDRGFEIVGAETILEYQPKEVRTLKQKLNVDLIAFQFVKKQNLTEQGRFILPVYVDEAFYSSEVNRGGQGSLGIEKQILAWASIHYLKMLTKIHDFFTALYSPDRPTGFQNDDLMVALIDRLDYKLMPYPTGLEKSLEVGRSTAGKCAFIVGPVEAVSIPPEIMIGLQAKDTMGVVPKIRSFTLKGV